jgi:pyrroloquinoline quinone (PQQ) biosynthesis protein C
MLTLKNTHNPIFGNQFGQIAVAHLNMEDNNIMPSELTTDSDSQQAILDALAPDASLSKLEEAAALLGNLAERAFSGAQEAYQTYQAIMWNVVHQRGGSVTDPKRMWLAQELYKVEDRFIPNVEAPDTTTSEEFKTFIEGVIIEQARLAHPMSAHLYQGTPSLEEIDLFLEHHWLRSSLFYRLFSEFGLRLEDFEDSTPIYENLFDESGNGDPEKAHPILLKNLLEYRGVPCEIDTASSMTEERAYLNNRIRCMRHPDLAWGLAVVYLIEEVTSANHKKIYKMLEKAGIPEEHLEFHRIHGFVDEVHAAELWGLVARRAHDAAFRRTFLRSVFQHFRVTQQYYDALWAKMRALPV